MILKSLAMAVGAAALTLSVAAGVQAQTLVVVGGTLIDGAGRAQIENSVIVIEDNRFKTIGRRGEVTIPPCAQVAAIRCRTSG
jgi:hypothetical protein